MRTNRGLFSTLPRPRSSLCRRFVFTLSSVLFFLTITNLVLRCSLRTFKLQVKGHLRVSTSDIEGEADGVNLPWNTTVKHDHFPYEYLINEPYFCHNINNLYILNVVGVGPNEVQARGRIRKLWGNTTWLNMTGFRTIFMVGASYDLRLMEDLRQESQQYHDIIQLDFHDTYGNLTVKTLCGLHWVLHYCPSPVWVLKSDTDVLVNIFELSRFLRRYDMQSNQTRKQLLCRRRGRAKPCRANCHRVKWRVTWAEYPHSHYPPYCMGPGYIIPRNLVAPLYNAASKKRPFRIEDTYYTGLLPTQLGWTNHIKHINDYFPWRPRSWKNSFIKKDLMILELDKWLGRAASALVWSNILHYQGLLPSNNHTL